MRRVVLLVGLICLAIARVPFASQEPAQVRPNIILLLLDDQDAFTPFWDAMPATSAMVRDRGMHFATAIAPTPICTPGRVTLLSGRLAHHTGVYTLVGTSGGQNFVTQLDRTFPVALSKLGYTTAMIGKSWGPRRINPGWTEWCSISGPKLYEGFGYEVTEQKVGEAPSTSRPRAYSTDFLSDRMARFLKDQQGRSEPFFVWLAPTAPHLPLPAAPRHEEATRRWSSGLPPRANFDEADLTDKSQWLRDSAAVRSTAVPYAQREYPRRMGSLLAVDEMMARIRAQLIAQGKWENTVIVVTSDNGYNLGAHRPIHKQAPYEESLRIPLFIAGPGVVRAQIHRIVGLHDLAPTFVELAGGKAADDLDGKSLVPFLRRGDKDESGWRTSLVCEYNAGGVSPGHNPGGAMHDGYALDVPTFRAVRTETHKLIRFPSTGEEELYELKADPFELTNLLRPGADASITGLRDELNTLLNAQEHHPGGVAP